MIFTVALLAMAFAVQPAKSPEKQRVAKAKSTQITTDSKHPANNSQQPQPQAVPSPTAGMPSITNNPNANTSSNDIEIQRKIEIFTGLLVAVGIIQAGIFAWQACVFGKTLRAIRVQTTAMLRQTRLLRKYTAATERGVEATEKTVEVLQAEQRARVGATRVEITEFHPGEQGKAVLWMKNFGKSTAVNVNVDWYMEPGPQRTHWYASGSNSPAVTLFPESEFPLAIETPSPISVDEFEAIRIGKSFLYVWGLVQYRVLDPGQPIYNGQFSFAYDHRLNQFWPCGGFWETE